MSVSTLPAPSLATAPGVRVIRVGLLGFGQVGQAVARAAAAAAPRLRARGCAVAIECALVRDVAKPRRAPAIARLTTNAEAFLRGRYDVVIDVMAGREPAATLAGRVLGRGTPVVSANKVMIAADGPRLRRIAARAGTSLRVDAAVIAGVPFVGTFERRPLAADVTRFAGIVNATSHFILSRVAAGLAFEDALRDAQAHGYAEPDAAADISGADALAKLVLLCETLFGAVIRPSDVRVAGIAGVTREDLAEAARRGGAVKPVIAAERIAGRGAPFISAFVGPAFVRASHPLASVTGRGNAIVIDSRHSGRLVFAGPGAGPDVTAATILDDAIEAATEGRDRQGGPGAATPLIVRSPAVSGRWRTLDA
ncbi:MAG TPA: homoserine dehydrogenase [Vicinamibacterales bacterium]